LSLFLPQRLAIESYGDGGFRFGHLSHRGSLLVLPSGMHAWTVDDVQRLTAKDFDPVFAEMRNMDFLLLGTGARMQRPGKAVVDVFQSRGLPLDVMDTGAAIRTYNTVLAEKRRVGAALIAVGQGA
jgi:uncharacterized protein